MAKRRATNFTQSELARIFKAAKAAGETVQVEIHPDGRMTATPIQSKKSAPELNEWDE